MSGATMRVVLYLDVWPGYDPKFASATANPGAKVEGVRRYQVVVNVPDPHAPDEVVPVMATEIDDGGSGEGRP